MNLTLTILDKDFEHLEAGAKLQKQTVEELLAPVVAREARRQFHIVRCQPKPKQAAPEPDRELRAVEMSLRGVYARLRSLYGEEYPSLYGEQEARFLGLLAEKNLPALLAFEKEMPWQRKR